MRGSRLVSLLLGLGVSVAVSAALWYYFGTPFVFLFLPFVPFLFWRRGGVGGSGEAPPKPPKRCPVCGFETRTPAYDYCPRDGSALRTGE